MQKRSDKCKENKSMKNQLKIKSKGNYSQSKYILNLIL